MKKHLVLFIAAILIIQNGFSQIKSKVDERFELTSTVFALAGVPEYCRCAIPSYDQDLITDLKPYDLTDPINFIRELNQIHGVGYDAVSTTAEMLEIQNGMIRLQSQYNIAKIGEYDSRWTPELFAKYITMLNKFYKQSNFRKFFDNHRELYAKAEQSMNELLENAATEWFESFYGSKLDSDITIYVSLSNGPSNYAMNHGVLIGMMSDANGQPIADEDNTMQLLVHELSHHYMNSICFGHWSEMEAAANKMYPYVQNIVGKYAYQGAKTTFCEWMVNLAALMYMKESDNKLFTWMVKSKIEKGFIWMQRSVDFMDNFYAHRDLYPHFEDFMPQLITFLNYTANNYDFVIREFENRQPYITHVYPAVDSDISNAEQIEITFSEPMLGSYGFNGAGETDTKVLYFKDVKWSDDYRKVYLILKPEEAEVNSVYGIQLAPDFFQSARYFWLDERCANLLFNTIQP